VKTRTKTAARWLLALAMVAIGIAHFTDPEPFVKIVPSYLPWPLGLVWISGGFEVLGGIALLPPQTRSAAGWCLIALYVAVFPANINMAVNHIQITAEPLPIWALYARLPLQPVFIAWAYWVSRPARATSDERRATSEHH